MYASSSFFDSLRERVALERRIAYAAAREDIEVSCLERDPERTTGGWWDTKDVPAHDAECVSDAIRYLDLRGLLQRWPGSPHIVRVLDEPEEPAGHGEHAGKVD